MNNPTGYKNINASQQLKALPGTLSGVFVSAASGSPTIQFRDGIGSDAIAYATGVFTLGGAMVPAKYAESVLTASGAIVDGETVTIGTTVYRFKDTMTQAYDVQIGVSDAVTLDNLKAAINATGTPGTEYFAGTLVHPTVIATTNTDTTQKVVARVIGTAANTTATTETGTNLAWEDTTLGGGTGSSVAGVATTGAQLVIDGVTYTFTTSLAETHGLTAIPYQVLWETSDAVALDNLKLAINEGTGVGTKWGTGTAIHPTVHATTNTDTAQTVEANTAGPAGNSITTTENMANGSWGGATLSGGSGSDEVIVDTFTPVAATMYRFPKTATKTGLFIEIGGTVSCTPFFD